MTEHVVVDRRFRGPPHSGHGGYSCGLVAERVGCDCAWASLRVPPPLDRAFTVERRDGGAVRLLDGDTLVAEGGPADLELDVPDPVDADVAARASLARPWIDKHPFPGCFGCGPERSQDEAVAVHMGAIEGTDLFAATWTPLAEFAGADGAVAPLYAWSALDCPTAAPAMPPGAPCVLARLTARLIAPITPEVRHTVIAWPLGHDGRKHTGGAAIHAPDGTLCAYSEGLWIELRDPSVVDARV